MTHIEFGHTCTGLIIKLRLKLLNIIGINLCFYASNVETKIVGETRVREASGTNRRKRFGSTPKAWVSR